MQFYIGDIISTIFILVVLGAMFFFLIKMIKIGKSTHLPLPPETLQQQINELKTRVKQLERQVQHLSERG
ncbi:hypothetical protein ACIP9G_06100 [Lysinibacillus sp. NPDC093197]|uniref:hypothetical protein n=1 Tax=Lysinibacillus sp. NPDC093197 TaxID=3364132 RepID=UPI003828344C